MKIFLWPVAAFGALEQWVGYLGTRLRGPATRLAQHKPTARQVLAASLAFVIFLGILWQRCGVLGCPAVEQLSAYQPGGESVLLDRDGRQFAILSPVEHAVVSLKELPKYVPQAFVAVEDKRFYEHSGIDYRRVFGSLLANVKAGSVAQGFSTITMQLARNVWPERLPGAQRTLKRKILEIRVALEIERKFTKDEILELYLNNIYFGGGAYGIEAAARNYFGHSARHLSLDEAAVLAALPKSPRTYDPRRNPEQSATRRNLVLDMMAAQGRIDADEAQAAGAARLSVRREPPSDRGRPSFAPYFVEAVRRELEDRLGEDLYTAPLRVHTTLDRRAQEIAEQELSRQLRAVESGEYGRFRGKRYSSALDPGGDPEYLQGAALLMQVQTGDILAHVGGRDFQQSRFDRATRALRQPGSAFKPFVFAVALRDGYAPSQHIADTPLRMELPGGEVWEPRNFGGEFEGDVTLREALVRSKNVPTVRLAAAVGIPDVIRLARRAGIRSPIPDLPSVAIGTGNVTPIDLTAAYTAFAGMGEASTPRGITRVEDADGNVVWDNDAEVRQVLDPAVAYPGHQPADRRREQRHGRRRAARRLLRTGSGQDRHDQRRRGRVVRRLHARCGRHRLDGFRQPETDFAGCNGRKAGRAGVGTDHAPRDAQPRAISRMDRAEADPSRRRGPEHGAGACAGMPSRTRARGARVIHCRQAARFRLSARHAGVRRTGRAGKADRVERSSVQARSHMGNQPLRQREAGT